MLNGVPTTFSGFVRHIEELLITCRETQQQHQEKLRLFLEKFSLKDVKSMSDHFDIDSSDLVALSKVANHYSLVVTAGLAPIIFSFETILKDIKSTDNENISVLLQNNTKMLELAGFPQRQHELDSLIVQKVKLEDKIQVLQNTHKQITASAKKLASFHINIDALSAQIIIIQDETALCETELASLPEKITRLKVGLMCSTHEKLLAAYFDARKSLEVINRTLLQEAQSLHPLSELLSNAKRTINKVELSKDEECDANEYGGHFDLSKKPLKQADEDNWDDADWDSPSAASSSVPSKKTDNFHNTDLLAALSDVVDESKKVLIAGNAEYAIDTTKPFPPIITSAYRPLSSSDGASSSSANIDDMAGRMATLRLNSSL